MSGNTLTARLSILIALALAGYPLLVYFGLRYLGATWIAACLLALSAGRLLWRRDGRGAALGAKSIAIICAGGILLGLVGVLRRSPDAALLYPALVNAVMLAVFAHSLAFPPTVIERIARLREGVLSAAGVAYTRKVTMIWTVFFVFNGAAALYTALYASMETWALYNGVIAYVLIGTLVAGERLVRVFVLRRTQT